MKPRHARNLLFSLDALDDDALQFQGVIHSFHRQIRKLRHLLARLTHEGHRHDFA